jgi:tetratricopeptide (TPR) repeat protein
VIARGAGLKRESIGIFLNLARLHLSEDPRRALESATEGLKVAREIGDALSEANAYVDLADAHKELENVNDAAASYESALGIYQRLSSVQGELLTLGRLSLLYSESDVERARQFNESGIALAERLGDKNALLRLLANRAHMEQTAGLSPDAVSGYYERAISLATELENKDEIRDLQEELAQFKSDQAFSMTLDHDIQVSPPVSFKPKPRSKSAGRRLK